MGVKINITVAVLIALFALSPQWTWHCIMIVDFFTPWSAFNSPAVQAYHRYLLSTMPEVSEMPAIEILKEDATLETISKATNYYTVPVIIRGAIKDAPALKQWGDRDWWVENYGDEEMLCKTVGKAMNRPACTVKESFASRNNTGLDERLYISGESAVFDRREELLAMVDSDPNFNLDDLIAGPRVFTQIFMGFPGMGSDVHAAVGCNVFRQITGQKKWWLFPQSMTPYVYASLNPNGFSAHTKTKVGKGHEEESEWMKKLTRYTVTLNPGDILINTAWYWHGIDNLGLDEDPDALVIGVPTRYSIPYAAASFKANWLLSSIAMGSIAKTYGGLGKFTSSGGSGLQKGIEKARVARARQMAAAED